MHKTKKKQKLLVNPVLGFLGFHRIAEHNLLMATIDLTLDEPVVVDLTMDEPAAEPGDGMESDDDFAETTFEAFIGGYCILGYMTFIIGELLEFEWTREKWQIVRNNDDPRLGATYARREIRNTQLGRNRFPSFVHAKQLRTIKAGDPQAHHTDVDPDLARRLGLFVLLGNTSDTPCCVLIGTDEVWLQPGICVVFPAWVIHAGSGFEHASRIYVLFSNRVLSPTEVQEAEQSSETLGFTTDIPTYKGLDAARVAPPTLV